MASGRRRAGAEWLFYAGFVGVMTVWIWLERAAFRYELGDKWLMLKQGVVTKQELHIPYGVIQNVVVSRDLFDRVFGLATLTIENAAVGAGITVGRGYETGRRGREGRNLALIGFYGKKGDIPGV